MLINPGARQRVAGFEAADKNKMREKWTEKWFCCFLFFNFLSWRFISLCMWGSWCHRGKWVAWVLERTENVFCLGLCPCHRWFLSLWGSWPVLPDLPQKAMDMEISSKIEHKMDFATFSFPEEKKDFCPFLLILFGSWQRCSSLYLLELHKARFLVKSATGGRQSNIAWVQRKRCAWEIVLFNLVSILSARWRGPEWRVWSRDCTAGSNLWPFLHLPSTTVAQLKIYNSKTVRWHTVRLLWHLELRRAFFPSVSKRQRVEMHHSWTVEIFMRKSAGEDELQHDQRLCSPGSRGKSVPVLLSDACLKRITKTGSVISHGE